MSFHWPVRVYWEDTDAGGVVYYANYLRFLERARTEALREAGLDQSALREATGVVMVVSNIDVDFKAPARLDDELVVTVDLAGRRAASFTMTQEIRRVADDALLINARVEAACLDGERWRPCRFPPLLAEALDRLT
ncbi:MAG: tol-pal system-associated acyl-CoA thioesterase [Pseudomonadota bacterium]